jgi:hypothetical protein
MELLMTLGVKILRWNKKMLTYDERELMGQKAAIISFGRK